MVAWILGAALLIAFAAALALWLALRRSRARLAAVDALSESTRAELRATVEQETEQLVTEVRRTVARTRADTASLLADDERRHAEARRAELARREEEMGAAVAAAWSDVERRVEERLRGFSDDVDRAQLHLEAQLGKLEQRRRQAIAEVETRIEAEAAELGSTAEQQRKLVLRLREELERAASSAVTEALDELESQTVERRRAIDEITERLRAR